LKHYIVAYDISSPKRAVLVRKLVYLYSMGGQKSSLEVILDRKNLKGLIKELKPILKKGDSINIIEVDSNVISFGKVDKLNYDNGVIIL